MINWRNSQATAILRSAAGTSNQVARLQTGFVASLDTPEMLKLFVRDIIRARSDREFFFPDRFADAAWNILLELTLAVYEERQVSVANLCYAARVPTTTALREINALQGEGIIVRTVSATDKRRAYIALAPESLYRMNQLLLRMRKRLSHSWIEDITEPDECDIANL